MLDNVSHSLLTGFSKLTRKERFQRLLELGALTADDVFYLNQGGIKDIHLAEHFIENAIGYFQLPLGVAPNIRIDGREYVIPMAVEETSIIAALSKTAKWIKADGEISTYVTGHEIIGQIQLPRISNINEFTQHFEINKLYWIGQVNAEVVKNMVKRGGGVTDLQLRFITRPDHGSMAIIHVFMNSCDAMGANLINQALEYLKKPIESITHETVSLCILSNLNDRKLTTAKIVLDNIDPTLGEQIQEASLFATIDPYRAATHNKGVMNGIDPILIATGNDWRAVEAGIHAYAARSGQYTAITQWRYESGRLYGELTAPIVVGTVGGVTSLHPTAKMCLNMMNIESANHLSRIIAAVGLIQNLGAIKALCTEGINKGHLKLHLNNLVLQSDATDTEKSVLKDQLQKLLNINNRVSLNNAREILTKMRQHVPA